MGVPVRHRNRYHHLRGVSDGELLHLWRFPAFWVDALNPSLCSGAHVEAPVITEVEGIPITDMWKYRGPLLPGETVYPITIPNMPTADGIYGYTRYGRIIRLTSERGTRPVNRAMGQFWSGPKIGQRRLHVNIMRHLPEGRALYVARLGCWALFGPNCLNPDLEAAHFPDDNTANNAEWNLLPVTKKVNSSEHKRLQGTIPYGERHASSKLTAEQVLEIRRTYIPRDREYGQSALGRKYGVSQSVIHDIIKRIMWPHI